MLLACLAAALSGCAAVITPPQEMRQPTTVLLLDHGRHVSLVLPAGDGLMRYAYGDWAWYAEMRTGFTDALRALLRPSPAALGRRALRPPPQAAAVRAQLRVGVQSIHVLHVEEARVRALVQRLDALFHGRTQRYNRAYDLHFVSHPTPYRIGHNSNHVVADWLRELGCEVRGPVVLADWRLAEEGT